MTPHRYTKSERESKSERAIEVNYPQPDVANAMSNKERTFISVDIKRTPFFPLSRSLSLQFGNFLPHSK